VSVRARSALLTGIALTTGALFALYLRQSRSVAVGSDGGSIALQAWAMLHGNVLLHGWAMSDVSFYSTELPQYVLLERLRGLSPDVLHVGGAMTYAILVLLAALVAKGRATGRDAVIRALIAAGIMLAPAAGDATSTLLLTPDHLGSAVPVLLAWLVIDRSGPRRYVPAAVGALLAWGMVADRLIEVTGVIPLVAVCGIRVGQHALKHRRDLGRTADAAAGEPLPSAATAPWWFEVCLAVAAVAAVGAADLVSAFIRASGGFTLRPVGTRFAGSAEIPHNVVLTVQGVLMIFGATFSHGQPVNLVFSSLHLTGVILVAVAFGVAVGRFFRRDELLVPALALAIALNLLLYVHGRYAQDLLSTREITDVLPFGAVLAGRVLAGPVARVRIKGKNVLMPALAAVLAGYAVTLVIYSDQPRVLAQNQDLAGWLVAHHLSDGLAASYWLSDSVTADSGGRAADRQVSIRDGRLAAPDSGWGYDRYWYKPRSYRADFVVTNAAAGTSAWHSLLNSARLTFGPPARIYSYQQYTVLVWGKNLLTRLG
jgi:hypothetical protein